MTDATASIYNMVYVVMAFSSQIIPCALFTLFMHVFAFSLLAEVAGKELHVLMVDFEGDESNDSTIS